MVTQNVVHARGGVLWIHKMWSMHVVGYYAALERQEDGHRLQPATERHICAYEELRVVRAQRQGRVVGANAGRRRGCQCLRGTDFQSHRMKSPGVGRHLQPLGNPNAFNAPKLDTETMKMANVICILPQYLKSEGL